MSHSIVDLVDVLKRTGIREGYTILDFGCGEGTYTIPAAIIVGEKGKVYAIDKDEYSLNKLKSKIEDKRLTNIVILKTSGNLEIFLNDESIDIVLLFDILHSWYFPKSYERLILLREIYRVLKKSGYLLFYPGDPEVFSYNEELKDILKDIQQVGFIRIQVFHEKILYEGIPVNGHVYKFKKSDNKKRKII